MLGQESFVRGLILAGRWSLKKSMEWEGDGSCRGGDAVDCHFFFTWTVAELNNYRC
jgi:hypothetical protein